MKKIGPIAAVGSLLLLCGCSEAAAVSTDESRRVEAATQEMKAQQALTDRLEASRRAERAEAYKQELALSEARRGIRQVSAPAPR